MPMAETQKQEKVLSFRNVTLTVPQAGGKTRNILNQVSGIIRPGEVVAIMGPSGAGKSTMLDSLAGRVTPSQGKVYINSQPRDSNFKHYSSYVQQEDSLFGSLTVRETLQFAAAVNVPPEPGASVATEEKRLMEIEHAATAMGLQSCMDTRVGDVFFKGISGGQKRRLSIAIELLKQPRVLLLDEPTSGLDSTSAHRVMSSVRQLAKEGRTVVVTIHQPSSDVFRLVDRLLLMSRGCIAYFGPALGVIEYFERLGHPCPAMTNPADFAIELVNTDFEGDQMEPSPSMPLMEIVSLSGSGSIVADAKTQVVQATAAAAAGDIEPVSVKERAAQLIEKWRDGPGQAVMKELDALVGSIDSPIVDTSPLHGASTFATPMSTQVWFLTRRALQDAALNPGVIWARLVMYTALAVMLATMYWNTGANIGQKQVSDIASVLFFIAAFFIFMSVAALPSFILEAAVFLRESNNAWYSPAAYVISISFASMPGTFLIALFSSAIVFPSLQLAGSYGIFLCDLFLSLWCAEAFMSLVAVACRGLLLLGMAAAAGTFAMFMLIEGFFINRSSLAAFWTAISYISMHRYSFEAFMMNQFGHVGSVACGASLCQFQSGDDVLAFYGMGNTVIWQDFIILIAMTIIYRMLQWFILVRFYTKQ